ncbi:uncharacterized protein LOC124682887 [Lolium rigidum]|uniref:uncharacterized protein LOC124682887 n=1 Tax=Lolium rigidum TaxID=89674 RepID=UPI001F5C6B56|nr:uncharacterized protein LOC124682887 [Lolium rigidum]
MSGGGRKPTGDEAEVEALLRAAQDAVLLKLQSNSHLVSSSSSAASNPPALDPAPDSLDDDLARRFDALRSRPPAPKRPDAASPGMDEMEARFAALKGGAAGPEKETKVSLEDLGDESEEDEVEKVMRWAMDAARLDVATAGGGVTPSAEEEKEEEDKSSASSEEDEEDRLELEMEKRKEEMLSKKNKAKNRWFFF